MLLSGLLFLAIGTIWRHHIRERSDIRGSWGISLLSQAREDKIRLPIFLPIYLSRASFQQNKHIKVVLVSSQDQLTTPSWRKRRSYAVYHVYIPRYILFFPSEIVRRVVAESSLD